MIELTWVVDDVAASPLRAEHGYAMWITTRVGQVLFDTGGSGSTLLHNLDTLDLAPERLDAVALSHGHDDHTGGLAALSEHLVPTTPVVAHPTLFRARYSGKSGEMVMRGIPVPQSELVDKVALRFSREPVALIPGVWTTGEISPRPEPEGRSRWHHIMENDDFVSDPYEDDLSLVVEVSDDALAVVCGCCHAGLLNTLQTVKRHWSSSVVAIVGGVHLANASADVIDDVTDALREISSLRYLWLGHCSGDAKCEAARSALPGVTVLDETAGRRMIFESGEVRCK